MPNLNSVIVMGNLSRAPELRYTKSGSPVCEMSIAVSRKNGNKDKTSFFDVVVWGKSAENCSRYLAKGSCALFSGYLEQEIWEDRSAGKRRSAVKIVAETVQFIFSPKRNEAPDTSYGVYGRDDEPTYPPAPQRQQNAVPDCTVNGIDEDISY